jgi:tRNA threonylcarbamoyladenosine biosynthesis protein TsaB
MPDAAAGRYHLLMPRALAIETSGRIGSVALVDADAVLVEEHFPHGLRHAAEMVPMIDRLCRQLGWGPRDLEEVYVSAGPGSFTGLRIGITLAKTLAFARHVRLVAVPTVRVLVENAPAEARQVIIVLDAKREQIFTARFQREGSGFEAQDPGAEEAGWTVIEPAHLESLGAMLQRAPRPVHLLGEGIPYHQDFIPTDDSGIIVTPAELWRARASAVAKVGLDLSRRGQFADPFKLAPIYIRVPEAEEKWRAGQGKLR